MVAFLFVTAAVAVVGGVMALVQGCRQWAHLRPSHPAIGISPVCCKPK
jgi:hypothetical protein